MPTLASAKSPLTKINKFFSSKSRNERKAKQLAKEIIKLESETGLTQEIQEVKLEDDKENLSPEPEIVEAKIEKAVSPKITTPETSKIEKVTTTPEKVKIERKLSEASEDPETQEITKSDSEDEDYVPEKPQKTSKKQLEKPPKQPKKETKKESKNEPKKDPKKKKITPKKQPKSDPNQPKITDFLRRSSRVPIERKRKMEEDSLHQKLDLEDDTKLEYLKIKVTKEKGRGVYAAQKLQIGDFIVEYAGELMTVKDGESREKAYSEDPAIGSYIYFINFKEKKYCIDATKESGRYGRLLNHSKLKPNCKTRLVEYPNGVPRLIIEAIKDIKVDEELLYDYGDRSEKSLKIHPWLKE